MKARYFKYTYLAKNKHFYYSFNVIKNTPYFFNCVFYLIFLNSLFMLIYASFFCELNEIINFFILKLLKNTFISKAKYVE